MFSASFSWTTDHSTCNCDFHVFVLMVRNNSMERTPLPPFGHISTNSPSFRHAPPPPNRQSRFEVVYPFLRTPNDIIPEAEKGETQG